MVEGHWSAISGEHGLTQLLTHYPEIDGIFACNDRMAVGALKTARQLVRRVPEDLAIIGYDDVQDAEYFYPGLSTMRQDMIELGHLAIRKLGQVIEAEQNGIACRPETAILQPAYHEEAARRELTIHQWLETLAARQKSGEHGLLALDWWNGICVNQHASVWCFGQKSQKSHAM